MKKRLFMFYALALSLAIPYNAYAMHIGEGFLPLEWAIFYFVFSAPFLYLSIRDIKKKTKNNKDLKMLLALMGAFVFVLSALKLPSVTGSSSHPTGTGLGAIVFGPFPMMAISLIVLLFQAIFLAHGGLTTLGANVTSMGIAGPLAAFGIYKLFKNKNKRLALFLGGFAGDLVTYIVTSIQLSLAFKGEGFMHSFTSFFSIFAVTQIPLAIVEGLVTMLIFDFIEKHCREELGLLEEVGM